MSRIELGRHQARQRIGVTAADGVGDRDEAVAQAEVGEVARQAAIGMGCLSMVSACQRRSLGKAFTQAIAAWSKLVAVMTSGTVAEESRVFLNLPIDVILPHGAADVRG